jgi:hypothetical protein
MRYRVLAATSPFNCRWIVPGSRSSLEGLELAVCRRLHGAERVVNEVECAGCPAWEPSPSVAPPSRCEIVGLLPVHSTHLSS